MMEEREMEGQSEKGGLTDSAKTSNPARTSLKSHPLFNNYDVWKRKLRENCYKRVREDRRRLLWIVRVMPDSQPLNLGSKVNLELLRVRLAEVHTEHLERGCSLKPKFCTETRFGVTALYILCTGCCTFEVVK